MKIKYKAFTMVELLVSMAIIGLLIAVAIWGIGMAQQSARNTERRDAASLMLAGMSEYYTRYNNEPDYACMNSNTFCYLSVIGAPCNKDSATTAKRYCFELPNRARLYDTDRGTYYFEIFSGTYRGETTSSSTKWFIKRNSSGKYICGYLEGGGYVNANDPQSLNCSELVIP